MKLAAQTSLLLSLATLLVAGGLGWYLVAQGRTLDFQQFLLDRREGLGQTTPDRSARCTYHLGERSFSVTRKVHGHLEQHEVALPDARVEGFFGAQQALVETRTTAETYDCVNGEHLSRPLDGDLGDPISRVLFSTSARNVAVVLQHGGRESGVEVLGFKVDAGQAQWDKQFGPGSAGLHGDVAFARLLGESLLVVLRHGTALELHTYNFRAGQKENPWNAHDPSSHKPFVAHGTLAGEPVFTDRGKGVQVVVRSGGTSTTYTYDYTCKLKAPDGQPDNPKPCAWK
ncbi:MAG: hypothetical protein U0514_02510 [Candidatus Andersenbacteria bacterium]